ncbi:MAG: hypothetical protein GY952_10870 [Rhodobacteraceae bacterium]|nr:hypothetical protein [Paracoccaceae bacterium]
MAHTDDSNGLSAKRSVWLITVIVVAALCAIGGASLILTLGWPGTQAKTQPRLSLLEEVTSLKSLNGYQSNQALSATSVGEVEPMIKALASRLQQNPDDAEGRRMLGWSYFSTERYGNAAQAYRQAAELQGDDADLYSAYGEALVRAARGQVTTIALGVFEKPWN